jgi:RNA recognition motif-containing protein
MGTRLYVGNLSFNSKENALSDHFGQHGDVVSCNIITDNASGRSRGFGFVEVASDDVATTAINAINGTDFDGRTIVVSAAYPREERSGVADSGSRDFSR